jgi:hypothetical protein
MDSSLSLKFSAYFSEDSVAENVYEQVVETYLTMERDVFLHSQYPVGDKDWNAAVDYLAIFFRKKIAWMVEVTRSRGSFDSKISEFVRDYEPRIREQLISDKIIPNEAIAGWQVGFWAFVPEWDVERIRNFFKQAGVQLYEVTPLDHALSLSAWDYRFPKGSN